MKNSESRVSLTGVDDCAQVYAHMLQGYLKAWIALKHFGTTP